MLAIAKRGEIRREEIPKDMIIAAFPSCIKGLYDTMASDRPVFHIGPFALTSFLVNIGMSVENIVNFFRSVSDFDERMPRCQVEHMAGVRGSRTKYIPPRCDILNCEIGFSLELLEFATFRNGRPNFYRKRKKPT